MTSATVWPLVALAAAMVYWAAPAEGTTCNLGYPRDGLAYIPPEQWTMRAGQTVELKCKDYHTMEGNPSVTCLSSGELTRKPTCKPKYKCPGGCRAGACNSSNVCECIPGTTGKSCQIPVCKQGCTSGGVCVDIDLCRCLSRTKVQRGESCPNTCNTRELIRGDDESNPRTVKIGEPIQWKCKPGFQIYQNGNATVQCKPNWLPRSFPPVCVRKTTCPADCDGVCYRYNACKCKNGQDVHYSDRGASCNNCRNGCGVGYCRGGKCRCPAGYTGAECEIKWCMFFGNINSHRRFKSVKFGVGEEWLCKTGYHVRGDPTVRCEDGDTVRKTRKAPECVAQCDKRCQGNCLKGQCYCPRHRTGQFCENKRGKCFLNYGYNAGEGMPKFLDAGETLKWECRQGYEVKNKQRTTITCHGDRRITPPKCIPKGSERYKCGECYIGVCTGPNTCTCDYGVTGATCRTPICTDDCSARGRCVEIETCECVDGRRANYSRGETCQVTQVEQPEAPLPEEQAEAPLPEEQAEAPLPVERPLSAGQAGGRPQQSMRPSRIETTVEEQPEDAVPAAESETAEEKQDENALLPFADPWETYIGHLYSYVNKKATFDKAEANCKSVGADLVRIDNARQETFVVGLLKNKKIPSERIQIWIGAHYNITSTSSSSFRWVGSNEPLEHYTGQAQLSNLEKEVQRHPNKKCMQRKNSTWMTTSCTARRRYVCRK